MYFAHLTECNGHTTVQTRSALADPVAKIAGLAKNLARPGETRPNSLNSNWATIHMDCLYLCLGMLCGYISVRVWGLGSV